jgi:MinD-like ATPase involved in chromosome partitioning or flagellar assembly
LITAVVRSDATGELTVDGETEAIRASESARVSEEILSRVTALAGALGRPVRLTTDDDRGTWPLIVHPDGNVKSGGAPLLKPVSEPRRAPQPELKGQLSTRPIPVTELVSDSTARIELPVDLRPLPQLAAARFSDAGETPLGLDDLGLDDLGHDVVSVAPSEQDGEFTQEQDTEFTPEPVAALPRPATDALAMHGEQAAEPASARSPRRGHAAAAEPDAVAEASLADASLPSRRHARVSFLDEETRPKPASHGWRGLIAKSGLRVPPSARELAERTDIHVVSQHWPGPRTIAVVNGKGGANKTPTTAMLSAVFARNGGSGVLAWDNNETRGTLGWRTEQGPHAATVQSLLPNAETLLSSGARAADLSQFVHHQTGDKYDVLRSNPTMLATEQRIAAEDFDRLHAVVTMYFRLIFVDSGNDESAERWLRMIDHTDQLVIATTALGEHAEAGALLLEALAQRDEHSAKLAANSVVIVSQSEKSSSLAVARGVADGFGSLARVAVSVPFDRAMHGGKLRYGDLAPATRRAWLRAAAAVAEGL